VPREPETPAPHDRFRPLTRFNIGLLPQWRHLDPELREAVEIVSLVLPFRTNAYVVGELIDWDRVPEDPIFRLTMPQRDMLEDDQYQAVRRLLRSGAERWRIDREAQRIRSELNPHPGGQATHNRPIWCGVDLPGIQHKYRETVLFFPSQGQTCHAYCTFCFRWAQFVGRNGLRFAANEGRHLAAYLRASSGVTDVLLTGGDPLVMKTAVLRRYVEPLLGIGSLSTIRIGTKAPAYWPQRFVTDEDADELLRLFEDIVSAGKHLAIMIHYSHPVELSTAVARQALERIRSAGASVRMQAPVVRHVNDNVGAWVELWTKGVRLGAVPYYMFVERDTGPKRYFEIPLVRCWDIYRNAYQQVSGLARTVRGPVMSCFPGKCHVLGVTEVGGRRAFALQFLQAREPDLVRRPFFARFDRTATWYDELVPLGPSDERFFVGPTQVPPGVVPPALDA
jgi:L-lysine 2,3-aminomutase